MPDPVAHFFARAKQHLTGSLTELRYGLIVTNPFLLSLGALALVFVLLIALLLRRRLRSRAAAPVARSAELSMRETLARRVRDGEEFTL